MIHHLKPPLSRKRLTLGPIPTKAELIKVRRCSGGPRVVQKGGSVNQIGGRATKRKMKCHADKKKLRTSWKL
jgi:hypothetical protein